MELKLADYTFVEVGVLGRTRGIKGYIHCHFHDEFVALEDSIQYIFLFDGGSPYPLKIMDRSWKNGFLVRFHEKYSIEDLRELSDNKVFLNKKDIPEALLKANDALENMEFIGYTFTDNTSQFTGIIEEILHYPHQLMISGSIEGKIHIFPLHEKYIEDIDEENKVIFFQLPEGIFSLND